MKVTYSKEEIIEFLEVIMLDLNDLRKEKIINCCINSIKNDFKEIDDTY